MKKEELKKLILTAGGARKADTAIKNCKVVNVFSGKIVEGDIALCGDQIAGVGEYEGEVEIDAEEDMRHLALSTATFISNPLI